jgi:hypothetical protein
MDKPTPKFLENVTEHPDVQRLIKQVIRSDNKIKQLQSENEHLINTVESTRQDYADLLNGNLDAELKAENEKLKKAITLLQEYIKLLGEEIDDLVGIAYAHGWKSSRFEKGKELREKIAEALKETEQ